MEEPVEKEARLKLFPDFWDCCGITRYVAGSCHPLMRFRGVERRELQPFQTFSFFFILKTGRRVQH
jgi:hypothetical protein